MTDIDFDELDKAVSSLMSQRESETASRSNDTSSDSAPVATSSQASVAHPAPSSATTPVTGAPSPVIRRQSGRFMDVKPPAQGSRLRPVRSASPESLSQPVALGPKDSVLSNKTLAPITQTTPQETAVSSPSSYALDTQAVPTESELMPDFEGYPIEDPGDSGLGSTLSLEGQLSAGSEPSVEPQDTPMQSPFLSDVEVDKRPLGIAMQDPLSQERPAEDQALTQPGEPVSTEPHADIVIKGEVAPVEPVNSWPEVQGGDVSPPAESLLPEFSAEVLALESDEVHTVNETSATVAIEAPVPVETATPIAESVYVANDVATVSDQAPELQSETVAPDLISKTETQSTTTDEISTQYAATVADAPEPNAIFDEAATEPQQLKHPEKKKSGWLVMVWIFLLLIIGVGGGIAGWYLLK